MAQVVPTIPKELQEQLKADRLQQYRARIFAVQMDIEAYQAIGDKEKMAQTQKSLNDFIAAYYAIEGM